MRKFHMNYLQTGSIARCPDSGRLSKIVEEVKVIVDEQMSKDDATIAYLLYRLLVSHGYNISIHTVLRCWSSLGWTFVVLCIAN